MRTSIKWNSLYCLSSTNMTLRKWKDFRYLSLWNSEEVRVGPEFQAVVPYTTATDAIKESLTCMQDRIEKECSQLWQPDKLPESKVVQYQRLYAKTVVSPLPTGRTVDDEEALYLLMQCDYNPDEALQRLHFRPVAPADIPSYLNTWTEDECAAFEKGLSLYDKDFRQIQETRLKHKTVAELVHFYYLWKKTARHDEFARLYRRDKKKPLHPGITDFMDCLAQEQDNLANSFIHTLPPDFHNRPSDPTVECNTPGLLSPAFPPEPSPIPTTPHVVMVPSESSQISSSPTTTTTTSRVAVTTTPNLGGSGVANVETIASITPSSPGRTTRTSITPSQLQQK